jgi:hypothetical protein
LGGVGEGGSSCTYEPAGSTYEPAGMSWEVTLGHWGTWGTLDSGGSLMHGGRRGGGPQGARRGLSAHRGRDCERAHARPVVAVAVGEGPGETLGGPAQRGGHGPGGERGGGQRAGRAGRLRHGKGAACCQGGPLARPMPAAGRSPSDTGRARTRRCRAPAPARRAGRRASWRPRWGLPSGWLRGRRARVQRMGSGRWWSAARGPRDRRL